MSSVLLPWVERMGWKMQSILLSGLRAPDIPTDSVKRITRWMRSVAQNNADPSKGYMEPQKIGYDLITRAMDELEYLPCHYVHHFADALRVIALFHPERAIGAFAAAVHEEIAQELFHFHPETDDEFHARHIDRPEAS